MVFNGQVIDPGGLGMFGKVWRQFWLSQLEACLLLVSSGQRSGMLLNIQQCKGPVPTAKTDLSPKYQQSRG